MKSVSKKRAVQLRHYDKIKQELEKELKERGEWKCVFSNTPIPDHLSWKDVSWHHLIGRDGDLLTDKKFIRPCADIYHTGDEGFHNHPVSWLKERWWWGVFLSNIKNIDTDLWYSYTLK